MRYRDPVKAVASHRLLIHRYYKSLCCSFLSAQLYYVHRKAKKKKSSLRAVYQKSFRIRLRDSNIDRVGINSVVVVGSSRIRPQMLGRMKGSWDTRFSLRSSLAWKSCSCPNGSWCYEPSTKVHAGAINLILWKCVFWRRKSWARNCSPLLCAIREAWLRHRHFKIGRRQNGAWNSVQWRRREGRAQVSNACVAQCIRAEQDRRVKCSASLCSVHHRTPELQGSPPWKLHERSDFHGVLVHCMLRLHCIGDADDVFQRREGDARTEGGP